MQCRCTQNSRRLIIKLSLVVHTKRKKERYKKNKKTSEMLLNVCRPQIALQHCTWHRHIFNSSDFYTHKCSAHCALFSKKIQEKILSKNVCGIYDFTRKTIYALSKSENGQRTKQPLYQQQKKATTRNRAPHKNNVHYPYMCPNK